MTTSRSSLTFLLVGLVAAACGKSPAPGTSSGSAVSGIAVPKEISALPAKSASGNALASALRRSALAGDAGTDYSSAQTFKFVDEQALSQFSTFNTIFKALSETHYADPEKDDRGCRREGRERGEGVDADVDG